MNYFFCDLRGTFDNEFNRDDNLDNFFELINNLIKLCHNNFTFSFITSDNDDYLNKHIMEAKIYFDKFNINQGPHFSESSEYMDGIFKKINFNNKIDQIKHLINNDDVDNVFFADDSTSNQFMVRGLFKRMCPNTRLISLVPGSLNKDTDTAYFSSQSGLPGLNETINKYIINNRSLSRYR